MIHKTKLNLNWSAHALQVGKGFNRDVWNRLEQWVRTLSEYSAIYVITGPLFLPRPGPDGKQYISYQVILKK